MSQDQPKTLSEKPAPRRRWPIWLAIATSCAIAAWFGWTRYLAPADPLTEFQFAMVTRGDVEDLVTATGTLQPRDFVDVGAQVSGQLKQIHVQIGDKVNRGDLLAEIEATVLQSKVDATGASLRNLRAQLRDREASLELARIQQRRQKNLMRLDATTEEELQKADAALRSAEAQIDALKAQIDQTESNLRADAANLEFTRIEAPMSGTVVSISARQGQTLNTNQQAPTILRIADLSTMTVQTQVSEADVTRLRPGMTAYFTTLGGRGQRWTGELTMIEPTPTVTNNVVLYNALFDVPNEDGQLMTQMTAQVFFIANATRDVLILPMSAINTSTSNTRPGAGTRAARGTGERDRSAAGERGGGMPDGKRASVRVVTPDGGLVEREIRYGLTNRIEAEILSGLAEGEKVVSGLRTAARATTGGMPPPMGPRL